MNGTTVEYIIVSVLGEVEKPVYVYEFSANDTTNLASATTYEELDTAVQSANLLTQMMTLQGESKVFEVRKVTTTVEGVEG